MLDYDPDSAAWGTALILAGFVACAIAAIRDARAGRMSASRQLLRAAVACALLLFGWICLNALLYLFPSDTAIGLLLALPIYVVAFFGILIAFFMSDRVSYALKTDQWLDRLHGKAERTCAICGDGMRKNTKLRMWFCDTCRVRADF
jgi:hypothetical protein